jgi:hypothetical protein
MNAQIRGKTRNRGYDWTIFDRPDEKNGCQDLAGFMAGDALSSRQGWTRTAVSLHNTYDFAIIKTIGVPPGLY